MKIKLTVDEEGNQLITLPTEILALALSKVPPKFFKPNAIPELHNLDDAYNDALLKEKIGRESLVQLKDYTAIAQAIHQIHKGGVGVVAPEEIEVGYDPHMGKADFTVQNQAEGRAIRFGTSKAPVHHLTQDEIEFWLPKEDTLDSAQAGEQADHTPES